jgi:hypothetical protein
MKPAERCTVPDAIETSRVSKRCDNTSSIPPVTIVAKFVSSMLYLGVNILGINGRQGIEFCVRAATMERV